MSIYSDDDDEGECYVTHGPDGEEYVFAPQFHPDAMAREALYHDIGKRLKAAETRLHSNDQGDLTVKHGVQGTNGDEDIVHVVTILSHVATKSEREAMEAVKAAEAAERDRLYHLAVADGTAAETYQDSASATVEEGYSADVNDTWGDVELDDALIEVSMDG